jgi:hypothetical protein
MNQLAAGGLGFGRKMSLACSEPTVARYNPKYIIAAIVPQAQMCENSHCRGSAELEKAMPTYLGGSILLYMPGILVAVAVLAGAHHRYTAMIIGLWRTGHDPNPQLDHCRVDSDGTRKSVPANSQGCHVSSLKRTIAEICTDTIAFAVGERHGTQDAKRKRKIYLLLHVLYLRVSWSRNGGNALT